jgi:serine/threonine protein kinase
VGRFEREARAAATLESPYVAKVLDVDTSPDGLPYMVIEFLEGNDLAEELTRRGRFPVMEAVAYVMEACVPIAQAHALGIIHRDLKPSNLFLAKKGNERVLKLLDFGISKVLAETDAKNTSSFTSLGTPHYMSPEHVRSASDVDRRSDIWSLGVILYELLTGAEPFRGEPTSVIAAIVADPVPLPRTRNADIPEALERVIMRALEKDPRKRFPDVRSLSQALAPFAPEEELVVASSEHKLPAPRSFPPPPMPVPVAVTVTVNNRDKETLVAPKPTRRARWVATIAGVGLVVGILSWWAARSSAEELPPTHVVTGVSASVAKPSLSATTPVIVETSQPVPIPSTRPAAPEVHAVASTKKPVATPPPAASNPFQL